MGNFDVSGNKPPQNIVLQLVDTKKDDNNFTVGNSAPKQFAELTSDAAEALKTQVLYKPKTEAKEYIPQGATPQEVRDILADKEKVGRSFFGFKRAIKTGIKKSKDPELAIKNLNFLLNAKDGKLSGYDISSILSTTEAINNDSSGSNFLKKHYGFEGGELDDASLSKITKIKKEDGLKAGIAAQQAAQQANEQIAQQTQQDLINQQMMGMNNPIMTQVPGMPTGVMAPM